MGVTMKKFFSQMTLPPFLKNTRLRKITIFIAISLILGLVIAFLYNFFIGIVLLLVACLGLVYTINTMNRVGEESDKYINDLSYQIMRGQQESLLEMPIGILIFNDEHVVEWINPYLQPYFDSSEIVGYPLDHSAPDLFDIIQANLDQTKPFEMTWRGHKFDMLVQKEYNTVYMMDITHYAEIESKYENGKIAVGQIFLDNFDEITQSMSDQDVSNLRNYITNELSSWAQEYEIFLKRIDADHYFILLYVSTLNQIESDKFKILDVIRENTSKQNLPLTLSMGISYDDNNLNNLADQAQSNLDLALGRGGDQVVVKAKDKEARYYGGKTNPMEKRTRVRARMISHALQELMKESDQIFVQGHAQPDMDAMGAAMGIRRIAQMNGKQCWIVMDEEEPHSDIKRLLNAIDDYPDIKESIITPDKALKKATDSSLLIMVDHSKPDMGVSGDLYKRLKNRVVIIDHHRRGEDFPENPILVYIEPYASSACELITEMFEYQSQDADPINQLEATAMLSGIVVDTQSFTIRTGTRTFDAASYLRSAGANADEMSDFMKESVTNYMDRNHLISMMEQIDENMALITAENDKEYDSVIAAQAVDSLLTIDGVEASFIVFKRTNGNIGISARSNGNINVQLIMEALGGGGHLSAGATQIPDESVSEVKKTLLGAINKIVNSDDEKADK